MLESRRRWVSPVYWLFGVSQLAAGCLSPVTRCWNIGTCDEPSDAGSKVPTQPGALSDAGGPGMVASVVASGQPSTDIPGATAGTATNTPSATSPISPSIDTTSAPPASVTPPGANCAGDEDCAAGVCLNGACAVCDAANDHGCEAAITGNRCFSSDTEVRCVECLEGDTYDGSAVPCGLNDRGTQLFECVDESWMETDCEDPDECKLGDLGDSDVECGVNDSGHYAKACPEGSWEVDTSTCVPDGACIDRDTQVGTTECGFSGYLEELCVSGQWVEQTNCVECQHPFYLPDEDFAAALRMREIETDPLDVNLENEFLDIQDANIVDLTGIQCFAHLTALSINNNLISDLTPLAGIPKLERLYLESNPIQSLAALSTLTRLTDLDVMFTNLRSLEGVEGMIRLETLFAAGNYLDDLAPLSGLSKLTLVDVRSNSYLDCANAALTQLKNRVPAIEVRSDCP
jgi:Leucine Rich repeats (2 copies)